MHKTNNRGKITGFKIEGMINGLQKVGMHRLWIYL